jgi:threonine dehydrogenase-like Zn-dependent dehydrogenase
MTDVAPGGSMPAIAVVPGTPHSLHLTTLPRPRPAPDQVLVRVRRVGICGTDQEIIDAKFGSPPAGSTILVLGHEVLGVVEEAGSETSGFRPGDLVSATVRRPDDCPYCRAGQVDMCQGLQYTERGIIGAHGYMAEQFVESPHYLVPVPPSLEEIGILVEPLSVVEKALRQANLIQRRLTAWAPATAVVLGAGPIGLLGTLLLRARGLEVTTVARRPGPHIASEIIEAAGARYLPTEGAALRQVAANLTPPDIIFEATGVAGVAFEAMELLGNDGVLVLLSLTGGDDLTPVPAAAINRAFVLGNKVMVGSVNSAAEDFEEGLADLARFEERWPGLTARLITRRLSGLTAFEEIAGHGGGVKTVIELD